MKVTYLMAVNKKGKTTKRELTNNGFVVLHGDAAKIIDSIDNGSVKLMYGSPPYPNAKRNYRTWKNSEYIDEINPVLEKSIPKIRDDGFIVINVKANRIHPKGNASSERSLIVEELMIHMKNKLGLYCVDIEIWLKTNPVPTGVRVACQDAYEYNLWFSKSSKWSINIDAIRRPYSKSSLKTYKNTRFKPRTNGVRYVSKEKSISPNINGALPINVIQGAVSNKTIQHQAVQPEYIPEKYIKACTNKNDVVLDPWCGSGTTGVVSIKLNRQFIGIDMQEEFVLLSQKRIKSSKEKLGST
jgi:DNA modification methylase